MWPMGLAHLCKYRDFFVDLFAMGAEKRGAADGVIRWGRYHWHGLLLFLGKFLIFEESIYMRYEKMFYGAGGHSGCRHVRKLRERSVAGTAGD